ncbi:MAG: hypothetical protein J7556_14820 [Acidovorax sp.]|nr:hypothetical protein [Acidovorax sp.]
MKTTNFPYTAWVLMPSFKPVQITLERISNGSTSYDEWHKAESGKFYHTDKIHPTKAAAIAWGLADLAKQQAAINKKQENLNKRRAALERWNS